MKRMMGFLTLMIIAGGLLQASAYASGSLSTGQGISARSAYAMGKALTFQKLVCPSRALRTTSTLPYSVRAAAPPVVRGSLTNRNSSTIT